MVTFLEENIEKIICDLGWGKDFLDTNQNHDPQNKILVNWILLKLRSFALQKILFRTMERQMTGSKYKQITYLIKDL